MNDHPVFGAFAKAHKEFFQALGPDGWQDLAGYEGVREKILSGAFDHSGQTGAVTRLSRWEAGAVVDQALSHAWCEEVFLISGSLSIGTPDQEREVLTEGNYAVRPAHVPHGPFFSKDGCLMIEFSYYPPKV
ncbi:MAG: cupin [Pseudomonadota bacterium]